MRVFPLSVPALLSLLGLLACVPDVRGCLQCARRIRYLQEDFISRQIDPSTQIALKVIKDGAYAKYKVGGVIDAATMYRASTEYQNEFDRFQNENHKNLEFAFVQIMTKGMKILEKHLKVFRHEGRCPNKCGLLYQRVMDCLSCKYKDLTCTKSPHCGVHPVRAEEGDQAVLDCFLPWHSLVRGRPEYHYSWSPGPPGTNTQQVEAASRVLVVTEASSLVLNQLRVDEQGTYRCSLQDRQDGTVFFSRVTFLLYVTPLPVQTHRPRLTLPALPPGYYSQMTKHLLRSSIAMVTALILIASGGVTVALWCGLMKRKHQRLVEVAKRGMMETSVRVV